MFVNYNQSILSYVSSIRKYFGLSSSYSENIKFSEIINNSRPKKIFVLLIDGMGANLVERKLPKESFLRKNMIFKTSTVFPSTTVAATTSIRNGKAPNENAWIGWVHYIKEIDDFIIPFYGKGFYNNKEYGKNFMLNLAPINFIEDELNKHGVNAKTLFPSFEENGFEDFDLMCKSLINYSKTNEYDFIYAYWDKYDTYMHEYGPNSEICDAYLNYLNYEIENIGSNLGNDTMLVIIADHGQIEVKEEYNLCGSKFEKYLQRKPSIDSRAVALYIKKDLQDEFEKEFTNEFENSFVLLNHKQMLDTHLFGDFDNHQRFEELIGDYMAIGKADTVLVYKEEDTPSLKGQHSGICEDEMLVPIIIYMKQL